jgi:hypothetical protein
MFFQAEKVKADFLTPAVERTVKWVAVCVTVFAVASLTSDRGITIDGRERQVKVESGSRTSPTIVIPPAEAEPAKPETEQQVVTQAPAEQSGTVISEPVPLPPVRPYGYYVVMHREQGDGEGGYVPVYHRCDISKRRLPDACYQPQEERKPIWRD